MVLNFGGTADILYFSARDVCQESCSCEKSTFRLLHVQKYNWREFHHLPHTCAISKGHLISKANCQAVVSPKKRTKGV